MRATFYMVVYNFNCVKALILYIHLILLTRFLIVSAR